MSENTSLAHSLLPGSERRATPGADKIGPTDPSLVIEVRLKLRRKASLPDLTTRPTSILSREEIGTQFGATQDDVDQVKRVLGAYGLTEVSENLATRSVVMSGTVAAVEKAFQVELSQYAHSGGSYRGREGNAYIPTELKDIVVGVFGLDNRPVVKKRPDPAFAAAEAKKPKPPKAPSPPKAESSWYTPAQLASHYNYPAGDGSGQTVGILEFGGGFFPDDLQQFCTLAGIEPPNVIAISADKQTKTNAKDGAEGEVMLDIEVVAGLCPKATIVVYFSGFSENGWITAIDAAIHDTTNKPSVVSVSWGYAEDAYIWSQAAMTQVNETLQEAALAGVTVCVAAGDDGSSDSVTTDGAAHVDFPSSSPYVLAVGGTTIPSKNAADIAWKEGTGLRASSGGSTGGGVSSIFPRPAWQAGIAIKSVNAGAIDGRIVPDVAANADWDVSPYLLVVDGSAQPNGGTSAATPLWAGLIALMNAQRPADKPVGYLTPVLYPAPGGSGNPSLGAGSVGCTDVLTGGNDTATAGGYLAGVGFDAVSGWGVPNGQKLLAALANI